ncbi:hypothetical protein RPMA_20445 [Tardiphaga alba]|uniref:DUF3558 domain-containing protein n=1 Tax=Tardiphaga alba TaxID=340268 RepID=A0ABX8ABK4_9BRAD|nr:hypothetical protein [Tardiphaga alba]QUS40944.1 hypothetical protein RPMA_20445 [Tardiphaga alba]
MTTIASFSATLLLIVGAATIAAADPIGSSYSSTADKDCRKISSTKIDGADIASERVCRGPAGFKVVKSEDDLRETISVGRTAKSANDQPAAGQGFGPFNSTTPTIEWRLHAGKPFAMIQRWHIADNDDTGKDGRPLSKQMLVVTRLPPGGACHVAYIDVKANPDANEIARKAADDLARNFDCKKDKVKVAGLNGRSIELALPR